MHVWSSRGPKVNVEAPLQKRQKTVTIKREDKQRVEKIMKFWAGERKKKRNVWRFGGGAVHEGAVQGGAVHGGGGPRKKSAKKKHTKKDQKPRAPKKNKDALAQNKRRTTS